MPLTLKSARAMCLCLFLLVELFPDQLGGEVKPVSRQASFLGVYSSAVGGVPHKAFSATPV